MQFLQPVSGSMHSVTSIACACRILWSARITTNIWVLRLPAQALNDWYEDELGLTDEDDHTPAHADEQSLGGSPGAEARRDPRLRAPKPADAKLASVSAAVIPAPVSDLEARRRVCSSSLKAPVDFARSSRLPPCGGLFREGSDGTHVLSTTSVRMATSQVCST